MLPLLLALASQATATTELPMPSNRKPLAFLLITPTGKVANTTSSELIRVISDLFTKHTDLKLEIVDPSAVRDCRGQMSCMIRAVRTDYNRAVYFLSGDEVAPYQEHLDYLAKKDTMYPRHLLLLSNLSLGEADRLSINMVDTDTALREFHEASRDAQGWEDIVEGRISKDALALPEVSGELKSEEEVRRFLEDRFHGELRRVFKKLGHWEPYGSISIATPLAGAGVKVGGVTVGTTGGGVTRITNVPAASEIEIEITHPEYKPYATQVTVDRGKQIDVAVELESAGNPIAPAFRSGMVWGGGAIAVAGAVMAIVAIATVDGQVKTYCPTVAGDDAGCGGSRFTRLGGYNPGRAPSFEDDVNAGGVLFAPLGYSLGIAGLTWSLGTLLIGEDGDIPWIQLVAGAVLGGVSYGLSALLEGDNPYDSGG